MSTDAPSSTLKESLQNDIRFRAIFFEGKPIKQALSETPFKSLNGYEAIRIDRNPSSIIEIVIEVYGKAKEGEPSRNGERARLKPNEVQKPTIIIHSKSLQNALRKVIEYYPSQTLTGITVAVHHPYKALVHHYNELQSYKDGCSNCTGTITSAEKCPDSPESSKSATQICGKETSHSLGVLLEYLRPHLIEYIDPEKQPCEDVYTKIDGKVSGLVVQEVSIKPKIDSSNPRYRSSSKDVSDRWIITVWDLAFADGRASGSEGLEDDETLLREPLDFGGGKKWSQYNKICPKTKGALTDHQYFLFPSVIGRLGVAEKMWMTFDIEDIFEIEWPEPSNCAIAKLVFSPERDDLELLKATIPKKNGVRRETNWIADSVRDKGAGLVVLLHGPPGTGKSFTVALQTAIRLATLEVQGKSEDGPAKTIEVLQDHFERVINRRKAFAEDIDRIKIMN
ncbi:hypothetical protein G7Y89_g5586 [Cudoniella acicularis]|uniref:Uncharacterized protein n=1 Tax=Cudoniella acicularis TaxID=354080 RepID=A0A8H4RM64_9HELO|nr:hypothetical protein G7Y89_g5586 [Cudoniella acicularis]